MAERWTETRPGRWERDGIVVRRTRHGRGRSLSSWQAHFPNRLHGGSSDTAEAAMAYADEHEARVMASNPKGGDEPVPEERHDADSESRNAVAPDAKCERASGAQGSDWRDEPPLRIRVARDDLGFWTCAAAVSGSPEYVRADALASAQRELAEARKLCGQKHDEANRYVNEMVLLKVRAEKAEARVAELEAALAMSAAREAGLRANLDIICSHARKIELAVSRGAIGPEEGSDGR